MSSVTRIGQVVLVTLPAVPTDQGARELVTRALARVEKLGCRKLVIDASNLEVADLFLGHTLVDMGHAAQLLDCEVAFAGVPPGPALVMSAMDIDLSGFAMYRTLDRALDDDQAVESIPPADAQAAEPQD